MEEQATTPEITETETLKDPFDFSNEPPIEMEQEAQPAEQPVESTTSPEMQKLQSEYDRLKEYTAKADKYLGHYFPDEASYDEFEKWHASKGQQPEPAYEAEPQQDESSYDVFDDLKRTKAQLAELQSAVSSMKEYQSNRQKNEAMDAVSSEANRLTEHHPWMQDKAFRDLAYRTYSAYAGKKSLEQVVKELSEFKHSNTQAIKQTPPTPIHSSAPGRSSGPPIEDPEDLYKGPEMFENIKRMTKKQFGIN
tara:strand:- start:1518 stop:2270 length:753 start_codon:yes stop_codon:yes gene_type:complete